jgi:uncharacterized protein YoaH (UPF0181 family)
MRNPYDILAVTSSATADEINKSFRELAKKLHPDANKDPESAARFVELNVAYEILSDEDKRRAFDRGEIDTTGALVPVSHYARARTRRTISVAIFAMLMLAAISTVWIARLTSQHQIDAAINGADTAISRPAVAENPADAVPSEQASASAQVEPRLILQQNDSYASNDTIPLGLQITGEAAGMAVEITGLPPGTTLSSGRPMGQRGWRIVAASVGSVMIHPPAGFGGALSFTAELRRADDRVIDRGTFRMDWTPMVASTAAGSTPDTSTSKDVASASPTEQTATPAVGEPELTHEQIDFLIERSQALMTEGDFSSARVLLRRAAEARDARAALALGATFDPIMLAILRSRGIAPDVAMARYWYRKASELGSEEADRRLKLIAPGDEPDQVAVGRVKVSRGERNTAKAVASDN